MLLKKIIPISIFVLTSILSFNTEYLDEFNQFDSNNNGRVSRYEFLQEKGGRAFDKGEDCSRVILAEFDKMDKNKDGYLTPEVFN